MAADLVAVARRHSARMAASAALQHNDRPASDVERWALLGENVGGGRSAAEAQEAFLASPGHLKEILSPRFTEVGVGVVWSGPMIWVTEVFRLPNGQAAAAPAPPVAAPVAVPAPPAAPAPVPAAAPAPPGPARAVAVAVAVAAVAGLASRAGARRTVSRPARDASAGTPP